MSTSPEQIAAIKQYYEKDAHDAYNRWGAGTGSIHFGYYPVPPVFDHLEPEQVAHLHRQSLISMVNYVARISRLSPGQIVLDAGCGTGGASFHLAQKGAKVIGINISAGQIHEAQTKKDALRSNPSFILSDFAQSGLKSGIFDTAIFLETLVHSPAKQEVLQEIARLLKKNGSVTIADYFIIKKHLSPSEKRSISQINTGWVLELASSDQSEEFLRQAGLKIDQKLNISSHVLPSINLAAESCKAHFRSNGYASLEVVNHRRATIEFESLIQNQTLAYLVLSARKS